MSSFKLSALLVLCTLFLKANSQEIQMITGTTIIAFKIKDTAWIAADTKATIHKSITKSSTYIKKDKISRDGNFFFAVAGVRQMGDKKSGITDFNKVLHCCIMKSKSLNEAINLFRDSVDKIFSNHQLEINNPMIEYFTKMGVIGAVILKFEATATQIIKVDYGFKLQNGVLTLEEIVSPRKADFAVIGSRDEILERVTSNPNIILRSQNKAHILAELIRLEAKSNSVDVGMPAIIYQITKSGVKKSKIY